MKLDEGSCSLNIKDKTMTTGAWSVTCPVLLGCYHSKRKSGQDQIGTCHGVQLDSKVVRETSYGVEVIIDHDHYEGENKRADTCILTEEVVEEIRAINLKTLDATDNSTEPIEKNSIWRESDPLTHLAPGLDRKWLDFPFFTDCRTLRYLSKKKTKVMFIMRGLPGSGKSSIVNILRSAYNDAIVCSADDYFLTEDGAYDFDATKLGSAHAFCQNKARSMCQNGTNVVIIDNTNVKQWEMKPYCYTAKLFGYIVVLVEPKTDWKLDPEELARRNKHGVPLSALKKKVTSFDHITPLYYGWFLSCSKSEDLISLASKIFAECLDKFPAFQRELGSQIGVGNSSYDDINQDMTRKILLKYYSERGKTTPLLHCTACFCASGKSSSGKKYDSRSDVQASCGRAFGLTLTGLVMTKRTCGLRVTLDEEEKSLFERPEESKWTGVSPSGDQRSQMNMKGSMGGDASGGASVMGSSSSLSSSGDGPLHKTKTEKLKISKKERKLLAKEKKKGRLHSKDDESVQTSSLSDLVNAKIAERNLPKSGEGREGDGLCKDTIETTSRIPGKDGASNINQYFPELRNSGFSRSSHITLETAHHVAAVETNFDVLTACDLENAWHTFASSDFVSVFKGKAIYFDAGICCVYFDKPIKINAVYSGWY